MYDENRFWLILKKGTKMKLRKLMVFSFNGILGTNFGSISGPSCEKKLSEKCSCYNAVIPLAPFVLT